MEIQFPIYMEISSTGSILDGYFNPFVFWYQWEYLLSSKELFFLQAI